MKDDVCSSILLDLNTVGRGLGDGERSLFNAISFILVCYGSCLGLVVSWVVGLKAGKSKRDVPRLRFPKGIGAGSFSHFHIIPIFFHQHPSS
jgi:hypothetical protein